MTFTNAHSMIADLCSSMANAIYDEMAMNNSWYRKNRNRHAFVQEHLMLNGQLYVKEAKKILGSMLTDKNISDDDKAKIFAALVKDNTLRGNYDQRPTPPILNA